ncbi:MAG: ATP phosphoribosyltransferase regulatory subunit [Eubacteriales bacterium]|nr:ATP phosphoribosyltransferase regulatory subunit [Eubacteriales bacterium]
MAESSLRHDERIMPALRELYRRHGYRRYRMSRFEEYDFYAENRSFLLGGSVLTFTDLDGRLMALRPDVTLSIVKNAREAPGLQKVYYNENVYRARPGDRSYRELPQTGLECIGELDDYSVGEVVMLACRSLAVISGEYVLDLSHLGYISALMDAAGLPEGDRGLLHLIRDKNGAAVRERCIRLGASEAYADIFAELSAAYGSFDEMILLLDRFAENDRMKDAVADLRGLYRHLEICGCAEHVNIDLALMSDMRYYNGVVFQGFVPGASSAVLSGGRYDLLLQRFGRQDGAVGFAVYLDQLERLASRDTAFDTDILLLYEDGTAPEALARTVRELTEAGSSVLVHRGSADGIRAERILQMTEEGVREYGSNA